MKLHLRPLATAEELARAAALDFAGLLRRRGGQGPAFGVALSGGRIARPFYEAIAALSAGPGGRAGDFDGVHFFWADERCVPPADPENNYAAARRFLFEPLRIPAENIHRIRGEIDAGFAVQEAEAEICRLMPLTSAGQPVLDLIILGLGEDGHVASLFPQEGLHWVEDSRVYRRVTAAKPPPERITLGYQPILAATEVWILVSGRGKGPALERLQAGDEALPAARIVARRENTIVFWEAAN